MHTDTVRIAVLRFFDPDHSEDEDRFIMFGMSFKLRILVICHCHREGDVMRENYNFSEMKSEKNPYTSRLKQPITIRLDKPTVSYFKALATEVGMPYQNLINLFLRDCAQHHKKITLNWV